MYVIGEDETFVPNDGLMFSASLACVPHRTALEASQQRCATKGVCITWSSNMSSQMNGVYRGKESMKDANGKLCVVTQVASSIMDWMQKA
jgi:hypothetical protein